MTLKQIIKFLIFSPLVDYHIWKRDSYSSHRTLQQIHQEKARHYYKKAYGKGHDE